MVRLGVFAAAAALAGSAIAAPVDANLEKRGPKLDLIILQFALTLEHLENVFYKEGLKSLPKSEFLAAGYSEDYYYNLQHIAYDEETHVVALEAAIKSVGATPVKACKYSFPYTDVPSFIYLSHALEKTGVSAYSGAAALISSDYYLTVAASILSVEAEHASYQRAALGAVPFPQPFETPLDGNAVYTIASQFIVSCPSTNMKLPFVAFPYLTYTGAAATCEEPDCSSPSVFVKRGATYDATPPSAGAVVSFTAAGKVPAGSYLTFVNGLAVTSVSATIKGKTVSAAIPDTILGGITYAFVTSSDISGDFSDFSDDAVLFGGGVFEVNPPAPVIHYNIRK